MPDAPTPPGLSDPNLQAIEHFVGSRRHLSPGDRRRAIVRASHQLHEELMSAPPVRFFRSMNQVAAPYPTRFALREACVHPAPFIQILNRLFVVQFDTADGIKTLLVAPNNWQTSALTPFFRRLRDTLPRQAVPLVSTAHASVAQLLDRVGITPEQVDYVTWDHLHTQDIREWFGTAREPGFFPNARLLVTSQEWASARDLLAPQADWYPPGGTDGLDESRILFFDQDVRLGESIVLMRTPGHTEGNHSIVVRTDAGIYVTSENGVSADCYAPQHSGLPGVRRWARQTGMDVVLNGNTLEGALDQYLSMVQEREVAGPSKKDPRFPNFLPSSELTPWWGAPGIRPTFLHGEVEHGRVVPAHELEGER